MKKLVILLFIVVATAAYAQYDNPFTPIRHSARDVNGDLHLRWDDFSAGQGTLECYYSTGTNAWSAANVNVLPSLEMEALAPYTYGQKLRYRLRYNLDYMNEQMTAMHAPFWDAESFPPNLNRMGYIGTDPTGDSLMVYSPNLDLEESYMAKVPDKLYFSMKNNSGLFPTMNSITSFNIYLATIVNPETVVDTLAYAMIYSFTIPGLLSNGLYKIRYDSITSMPTFTRLGNIQATVSSGTLHMACTMSDLTNDPDFGAWPSASNSLGMTGLTMAITIVDMQPSIGIGDYSTPALIVMEDNFYQQAANALPSVEVSSFDFNTNTLTLSYYDSQGDFPLIAEVRSAYGIPVDVYPVGSDYNNPISFVAQIPPAELGDLPWRFSDNGVDFVSGVYHAVANDDPLQIPEPLTCIMPNPIRELPAKLKLDGLENAHLDVAIYNLKGQKVQHLYGGIPAGKSLELSWNGLGDTKRLPSGIYFLSYQQRHRHQLHKFIVLP